MTEPTVPGEHPPEDRLTFPEHLPISAKVAEIARALHEHQVVVVAGATGSGKTTQLPKIALGMGRGLEKRIGLTQPRRIAATSVAARIAEELGSTLGEDVGYKVRFDDRTSPRTYVKVMTDGILLAEIQGDPLLTAYDTILVDEAHERSLTIDFLLGYLRQILPKRPDLKVVVSSATLDTERFSAFFGGAPIVQVEGRTFPVSVLYEPLDSEIDLAEGVADAVADLCGLDPRGDVLVFLPGEREIRETESCLRAREVRHAVIQPLFARLTAADQARVFAPSVGRKIILATNVAETSITLPGVVYVVDAGLARLSRYDPRSGVTRLQIEGVSQASADQRKGRCGRVREGICVRLYDEQSYDARPAYTDPEIRRTGLAGVILRMKSLGLGEVEEFPFLDPPDRGAIAEGYRVLQELGALDASKELTPLGASLARFPVDPRIGRMIMAGHELGCLREVLVIAAALNVIDVRERPREAEGKADRAHAPFRHEASDFVSLLKVWDFVREAEAKGSSNLRRVCRDTFLSFMRVREWKEIHRQLEDTVRELGLVKGDRRGRDEGRLAPKDEPAPAQAAGGKRGGPPEKAKKSSDPGDALHHALLTGLLSKIGQYNPEARIYIGAKQTKFAIHPSSGLGRKTPAWVMAFELVQTSQLFARNVAKIEPEWLLAAGPHMIRRSYSEPRWSARAGKAIVNEQCTLFGLVVAKDRIVDYTNVAPAEARTIFLDHALVRGEYTSKGRYQAKNEALLVEVARLKDKARRSDMLADDEALLAFFDARVPADVVDARSFEKFREAAEARDPDALVLSTSDVLVGDTKIEPADFPDSLVLFGTKVALAYLFEPHDEGDGITLDLPLVLLPQLKDGSLDFTIPGWHEEKILAILYELPRAERAKLGNLPDLAKRLAKRVRPFEGELVPKLVDAILNEEDVEIPARLFRVDTVATYLRLRVRLVDEAGKVLAETRDVRSLRERFAGRAREAFLDVPSASTWERTKVTTWDFGTLPDHVERRVGKVTVRSYPAIVDRGTSVDLTLLESLDAAEKASRDGILRLFAIAEKASLSAITPRLPKALVVASMGAAPVSRTQEDAFRARLVARILADTFDIDGALPRNRAAFDAVLARGAARMAGVARAYGDALAATRVELDKLDAAVRSASKHPSATLSIADIRAHLAGLFFAEFPGEMPLATLQHLPRYLRACGLRLGRAIADPRKDSDKLAPLVPLVRAFAVKKDLAKDRALVEELRWDLEELKVLVFAPELKTARPVSLAKITASLASLS